MSRFLHPAISIIVFLIAWEVLARQGFVHISLFPPPTTVLFAINEMMLSGELVRDFQASVGRVILGFVFGGIAGVVFGLLTGRVQAINNYLTPLVQIFRPLPPVAIIPLVIVWFGIGELSKVFSIAFAVFFPVWINSHIGAKEVPQVFIWGARTLGIKGWHIISKVIFPGALPFIIAGLRSGVAIAFVMVFVSELAGASSGIGYQISVSHLAYRIDRMIGALFILGFMGAVSDFLLIKLTQIFFPWLKLIKK